MGMWNIPAELGAWEQVSAQIETELHNGLCPADIAMSIIVAADEIFANISDYAYQGSDGAVEIMSQIEPLNDERKEYRLTFFDRGNEFNPLDTPEHEKGTLALHKYKSGVQGGFGIHIVKDKADRLSYKYENGQNVLCFVKYFVPTASQ
jgi:anti-sigma regulatory factor (Ser/Thr protein kinase)